MADHMVNAGSAVTLEQSSFRESPQKFRPLLPAEYVTAFSGQTDAPKARGDLMDRQRRP